MWLINLFPNLAALESASIEDVAFLALEKARRSGMSFMPHNLVLDIGFNPQPMVPTPQISPHDLVGFERIASEAFAWLEAERLIVKDFRGQDGSYIISRLGKAIVHSKDLSSYAKRAYLPKEVLHDAISGVALSPFLAGRYDEAVRAAFTKVEVAVRDAAGYGHDQYGVTMMRAAFQPGKKEGGGPLGPLTDPEMEFSEREAVAHLFAGAIGYIKNPLSHRELNIDDARVAASRVLLANDLMYTLAAHLARKRERDSDAMPT